MQENDGRQSAAVPSQYPPHCKTPWDNDGGAPKRLSGQEEVGLIMAAMATDRRNHQTDTDVLCPSPSLIRKKICSGLHLRGKGERNVISELMMAKKMSASAHTQAIICNFITYEFMTCTDIHFPPLSHRGQDRVYLTSCTLKTSLVPFLSLNKHREVPIT